MIVAPGNVGWGRILFARGPGSAVARCAAICRSPGLLSVIDQAVVSATSFLTSVLVGRLTLQEGLGVFFLGWNIVLLARAVQGDLITSPYMIYCRRRSVTDLPHYGGSVFVHQAVLALFTCALIVGAILLSGAVSGLAAFAPAAWALVVVTPLLLCREFVRNLAFAHLQVGCAMAIDVGISVLQLGTLLVLAGSGRLTVERAYLVTGLSCLPVLVAWALLYRPEWRFSPARIFADWRVNWRFGRWALASQLTGRAAAFLAPWLLAIVHGEAATGLLAACTTIVNLAGMFITGVSNYLTPKAAAAWADGGREELCRVLRRAAGLYGIVIGTFALAMVVGGEHIARAVYGSAYVGGGTTVALMSLSMFCNSFSIVVGNGLWALDQPRANFLADLVSLVVSTLVLAVVVVPWGVCGVAVALLSGSLVAVVLRFGAFRSALAQNAAPAGSAA